MLSDSVHTDRNPLLFYLLLNVFRRLMLVVQKWLGHLLVEGAFVDSRLPATEPVGVHAEQRLIVEPGCCRLEENIQFIKKV